MKTTVTVLFLLKRLDCNDGVSSYCETIIKGLAARGDKVVIVSGPVTEFYGSSTRRVSIRSSVIDWIVLDQISGKLPTPSAISKLLATIKQYEVDVISPQGLSMLPLASLLSRLCRRPVVANYHPSAVGDSLSRMETGMSKTKILMYRISINIFKPNKFIAISKDIFQFFHNQCGIDEKLLVHIGNGVDVEKFRPPSNMERESCRESLGIPSTKLTCVLIGRLNFVKGHDIAIDAIRLISESTPNLEIICLFGGDGDQSEDIQSYANENEKSRSKFKFLGFLPGDEALRNIYWATDIALLPSRFEGFGLVTAEAMSCGCVPIRTRSGGWQDQIIDGINGFLIPFNDPQALADRILDLSDPVRRAEMRQAAILYAQENLGKELMVQKTSNLYRSVANGSPQR